MMSSPFPGLYWTASTGQAGFVAIPAAATDGYTARSSASRDLKIGAREPRSRIEFMPSSPQVHRWGLEWFGTTSGSGQTDGGGLRPDLSGHTGDADIVVFRSAFVARTKPR